MAKNGKKNVKETPAKAPKARRRKQSKPKTEGFSMQAASQDSKFRSEVRRAVQTVMVEADTGEQITVSINDFSERDRKLGLAIIKGIRSEIGDDYDTFAVVTYYGEDASTIGVRFWNREAYAMKQFGDDPHADFKAKYLLLGGEAKAA